MRAAQLNYSAASRISPYTIEETDPVTAYGICSTSRGRSNSPIQSGSAIEVPLPNSLLDLRLRDPEMHLWQYGSFESNRTLAYVRHALNLSLDRHRSEVRHLVRIGTIFIFA
jgi:hypothetical protein